MAKPDEKVRVMEEIEARQAQKLEAVGRLAAGLAHELNTPVQFVGDSVHFIRDSLPGLTDLLAKYQALAAAVLAGTPAESIAQEALALAEELDLEFVLEHLPKAAARSLDGLERVARIVRSMKEFAHPDVNGMIEVDLNFAVENTLVIAKNEYKYLADVELDLGNIPAVMCHAGDVNQALLNVIINAAHAIEEVVAGTEQRGRILVRTRQEGDRVRISISDTGGGIPETVRDRIFDPFFTTKRVGKGSGQGLSIARSVVVDKHRGELGFETEVGKGTTFHLWIPVHPRAT
jgi:signal transduction histidine kinase